MSVSSLYALKRNEKKAKTEKKKKQNKGKTEDTKGSTIEN
jgi:hypothetical protein